MGKKILAGLISLILISQIASAFNLGIVSPDQFNKGKLSNFIAFYSYSNQEILRVVYFLFRIVGEKNLTCSFSENGTTIDCPSYFNVEKLHNFTINITGGESFNYNSITYSNDSSLNLTTDYYNITVNPKSLYSGNYSAELAVSSYNETFETSKDFKLNKIEFYDCSIRAKEGIIYLEDEYFSSKGQLNFYVPRKGAGDGEGYLISQSGRVHFSYRFKVVEAMDKTENSLSLGVKGKLKLGLDEEKDEDAIISVDKENSKISIEGKSFRADNMGISFMEKC